MLHRLPQLTLFLTLFLAIPLAYLFGRNQVDKINNMTPVSKLPERGTLLRQNGYEFINPLLECEISQEMSFVELTPFRQQLNDYVQKSLKSKKATHISVYFRDLNNGPWIGVDEKENFSPASLLKLPLAMAVYQTAENNPNILSAKLRTSKKLKWDERQTIVPQATVETNKEYSVPQLVEYMLQYSDNNSADLLLSLITQQQHYKIYQDLGLDIPLPQNNQPYSIRVKDYAAFFRILFNSSYLSKSSSNSLLQILTNSAFTAGLRAGVPSDIKIAHKFGERFFEKSPERQLHDCGIIYYPGHPYLLCVMTRGEQLSGLESVIKDISELTYNQVDSQIKNISSP